jgi:hypothetical protein
MGYARINVQKCVDYLTQIGVTLDQTTVAQWFDAQRAHRFCRGMKSPIASGWDWWCVNEHHLYVETRGRRSQKKGGMDECRECGRGFVHGVRRWTRLRDGAVRDSRPEEDRWRALDDPFYEPPRLMLG